MDGLTRDSVLRRSSDVSMRFSGREVTIDTRSGTTVRDATSTVAILAAFESPRPLGVVVDELVKQKSGGAISFMDMTYEVFALVEAGVLVVADGEGLAVPRLSGFADPAIHIAMLQDADRTEAYLEAIRGSVRPDDVVL